jgi:hypothetical protein
MVYQIPVHQLYRSIVGEQVNRSHQRGRFYPTDLRFRSDLQEIFFKGLVKHPEHVKGWGSQVEA